MKTTVQQVEVWVILPPRVLLLDVAGPIEVLRRANLEQDAVEFVVRYASPSEQIMSSIGLPLAGIPMLPRSVPENALIVLPGTADNVAFGADTSDERARKQESVIVEWLKQTVDTTHSLISICSGALLAARAGLLDGHACTTHHTDCAALAALAPNSKVLDNRLFVVDGRRYTSAGITAGTDLMLHLVSGYVGHPCAVRIARHLVLYLRREGSDPQISPWLDGRNHIHPAVHRVQDAIAGNPAAAWTLERLARVAHTSPRHLSRLFNEHAGMSIVDYVNALRVSLARELLQGSRLDMERVAERSGFASARQLRRAWKRMYEEGPAAIRASE
jgi:transcriptional regulator GlxA family with amidase domain